MRMIRQSWSRRGIVLGMVCFACDRDGGDGREAVARGNLSPVVASSARPAPEAVAGTLTVCERAESAQFDPASNAWYVSCQAKPAVPGDGFIAKVNATGTAVSTPQFVTGLNEPKGIRIHRGKLYVSDVDALVTVDVAAGRVLARTPVAGIDVRVPDSSFLNDVAVQASTGDVYVSDNRNDVLYRFDAAGGSPKLLVRSSALEAPNGLLVDERVAGAPRLLIAALGPGYDVARGVTAKLGGVLELSLADLNDGNDEVSVKHVSQRIGNLDGIEFDGTDLLVTDVFGGRLLRLSPTTGAPVFDDGDARLLRQGFAYSADLGIDPARRLVAVPEVGNGTVVFMDLSSL